VYEKTHRVSEDVTLQHRKLKTKNKDMENHPYLNHSKQRKPRSSRLMFSIPKLPSYMLEERNVRVLDPKGLVGKYLGTHDLDTSTIIVLNLS
jgi:hypothetical protein